MQIDQKVLMEKWGEVLDHTSSSVAPIKDSHRRFVTAVILENAAREAQVAAQYGQSGGLITESAAPTNQTAGIQNYDPVTIALLRRAMPNLIAYDVCGVQPMTGPTGLIFAMRSHYNNQTGPEAFYNEANTGFSSVTGGNNQILGDAAGNVGTAPTGVPNTYNFAGGMSTAQGEALGSTGNVAFGQMGLSIEKVSVTAQTRALMAKYSIEMAQDLRAIHGLDAESELANMLTTETLAEINREIIRTIYLTAKAGSQTEVATAGTYDLDVDANGRWLVEKFKGLIYQLSKEGNVIAKETRRGRGNLIICSSDVATALSMAGVLDYNPALIQNQMNVDDTGNTFAGVVNNQFRVYIDPYATSNYMVVGYKGADPKDAGLFYAPYVPLQMARAVDPDTLNPVIGFKTRYGVVANPYAEGLTKGAGEVRPNSNVYYRRTNLVGL